jgi:hypothetical protein
MVKKRNFSFILLIVILALAILLTFLLGKVYSGQVFGIDFNSVEKPIAIPGESPTYPELPVIIDEDVMPVPYAYYDYNKDGKTDLVRKEVDGNYYVYKNKGTNENQIFREGTKINTFEGKSLIENYKAQSTSSITTPAETQSWYYFNHSRYDLYIDSAYYDSDSNGPLLDDFFSEFDERFALLEATTNWSSEEYSVYGTKLKINITASVGCYGGSAYLGNANIQLSNPFYKTACQKPYYFNGIPYFGNPGELGDNWGYTSSTIHESIHSINPSSIIARSWFTEGFSRYYEYNTLSNYDGNGYLDINQETANTYIYNGDSGYNWQGYVANDYHDTTPLNNEIQVSRGYYITARMFSMMKDNHSLNWSKFYNLINNNRETIDEAWGKYMASEGNYLPCDMLILDLFGRASGKNFSEIQEIWRYDGPSGPGWGVRNWEDLDWYADLVSSLSFSKTNPSPGENINLTANVSNTGDVSLNDVSVRFYEGTNRINETFVSVPAYGNKIITYTGFTKPAGTYIISAKVDEDNIKIESNETNNDASGSITFAECNSTCHGDPVCDGVTNVQDVVKTVNVAFRGEAPVTDPNCP